MPRRTLIQYTILVLSRPSAAGGSFVIARVLGPTRDEFSSGGNKSNILLKAFECASRLCQCFQRFVDDVKKQKSINNTHHDGEILLGFRQHAPPLHELACV